MVFFLVVFGLKGGVPMKYLKVLSCVALGFFGGIFLSVCADFLVFHAYLIHTGVASKSELSEDYGLAMLLTFSYVISFVFGFFYVYSWASKRFNFRRG